MANRFARARPPSTERDALSHERPRIPHLLRRFVRPRGPEPLPIALHRRRIYVLPTPFGLFFAALLATMTLGGLNYSNNPALILCFLMLSVMLSALLRGYLNLSGVRLVSLDAAPVHAGSPQPRQPGPQQRSRLHGPGKNPPGGTHEGFHPQLRSPRL